MKKTYLDVKHSPLLKDLPEVPHIPSNRRKSKDILAETFKKMNIITKNQVIPSPGLNRSPKSPLKSPLKSPASGLKGKFGSKLMKSSSHTPLNSSDDENDLKTEDIGTNFIMGEQEQNILKFLEEENIIMANPKEKQFEYFETVKKNAFLFFSAVDRSKSEGKRFSLDSSSLLNKRRASLPRLIKGNESSAGSENESSPEVLSCGKAIIAGPAINGKEQVNFGYLNNNSEKKKSKFNKVIEKVDKSRHFNSMSPLARDTDAIRDQIINEFDVKKNNDEDLNSSHSSKISSSKDSDDDDDDSNISSEKKSQS